MPRIKFKDGLSKPAFSWEQVIVDQIRSGKVLPIISNRLHNDQILGGHNALAEAFAVSVGKQIRFANNNAVQRRY